MWTSKGFSDDFNQCNLNLKFPCTSTASWIILFWMVIILFKSNIRRKIKIAWLFPYIDVLCFAVLELWWSCEPDSMLDRDHRHWIYFVILMIIMICISPISWNVHRDFFLNAQKCKNCYDILYLKWLIIKKIRNKC